LERSGAIPHVLATKARGMAQKRGFRL
jgi:hypothetical protein